MRVAKLAPMTGKVGEEVERFLDRFLTPGFLPEPFIPPYPFETAGAEWFPMLDVTETEDEFIVRLEVPGRMVGVISSTDIITSEAEAEDATAREALFEDTMVRDIMTLHPLTVSREAEVREAAQQMLYADIHRLFVVDGERIVGVISTTDIMRAVATGRL